MFAADWRGPGRVDLLVGCIEGHIYLIPNDGAKARPAFGKAEKLKADGVMNAETWKALGPLIMDKEPAPEPAIVNAENNKKAPPDALDGPPQVAAALSFQACFDAGQDAWRGARVVKGDGL